MVKYKYPFHYIKLTLANLAIIILPSGVCVTHYNIVQALFKRFYSISCEFVHASESQFQSNKNLLNNILKQETITTLKPNIKILGT